MSARGCIPGKLAESGVVGGFDGEAVTAGVRLGAAAVLSVEVGVGYTTDTLAVWHFDGGAWTPYATNDFSYDGTYANFTVIGFSGYAVVAATAVPAPGVASLLVAGIFPLLLRRRRVRGFVTR